MALRYVVQTGRLLGVNEITVNNYTETTGTNQNHPRPTGTCDQL